MLELTPFSLFFTSGIFAVIVVILALERIWMKKKDDSTDTK